MTFLDCIPHQADPHSENDDEISSSGSCPPSYTISETRFPARVLCIARKAEVQYGETGRRGARCGRTYYDPPVARTRKGKRQMRPGSGRKL
jgi:hypothetical protein